MNSKNRYSMVRWLCSGLAFAAMFACQSLDRKYSDSALLIVKVDLDLQKKSPVQNIRFSTPRFAQLFLTRLPDDGSEPIRHSVQEDSYYIFKDVAAGNYSLKYGYVVLQDSMQVGSKPGESMADQAARMNASVRGENQLGAIAEWKDENQRTATTEALPDGVHYMGDFQVVMKFKFVSALLPNEVRVSGEKTEAGEKAAFEFLRSEWPGSPWAELIPQR